MRSAEKQKKKNIERKTNKTDKVSDVKLQKENTWILKVTGKGKNRFLALSAVAYSMRVGWLRFQFIPAPAWLVQQHSNAASLWPGYQWAFVV